MNIQATPKQPELPIEPPEASATERIRQLSYDNMLRSLTSLRWWIGMFPLDDEQRHEATVERLLEVCDDMRATILQWSGSP